MSYVFSATHDLLRSLELAVTNTLLGDVIGEYLSRIVGNGNEIEDSRPWQPGEPLANLDWKRELRTGEDYVYTYFEDLARPAQLIVDCGPTMNFGSVVRKAEYGLVAAAAFGFKLAEHKNPISAQVLRGSEIDFEPPGIGQYHAHVILESVLQAVKAGSHEGSVELSESLENARLDLTQPGLVLVVSDFLVDNGWEELAWAEPLSVLCVRNEVVAVQVVDPVELETLPFTGTVQSVTTGRQTLMSSSRRSKRNGLAAERQEKIEEKILESGADHLVLRTDEPWDLQIYDFVANRQHMMKGA